VTRGRAPVAPLPSGFGVWLDPSVRILDGGRTMLGGSPRRLLRLSAAAAARVGAWKRGAQPVTEAERRLARRLIDAGLAHPVPPSRTMPAATQACATIVIPVHDRPAGLRRCLAAIEDRKTVLVVDDASGERDAVAEVVRAAGARLVRRARNGGPGAARNTGLTAATTEVVAFVDCDCVPEPGWLDRLLEHFADPAVGVVAPRIVSLETGGGWLQRYEAVRSPLDLGAVPGPVVPQTRISYVPAAALVVRRAAAGSGFDEDMPTGEDVDFVWRVDAAGWRVRFEPAARVAHDHRTSLRSWMRRRADYGRSAAALAARHPRRLAPAIISPWSAAAWSLLLGGRWRCALAVLGAATCRVRFQLGELPGRNGIALRVVAGGTAGAGRLLAQAVTRAWLPLVLPALPRSPLARRMLLAAWLLPAATEWCQRRPALDPPRYAVARLLDDAAYCAGLWHGCVKLHAADPLIPAATRAVRATPKAA
jgi:mycofactocin system glycosyltransferase